VRTGEVVAIVFTCRDKKMGTVATLLLILTPLS